MDTFCLLELFFLHLVYFLVWSCFTVFDHICKSLFYWKYFLFVIYIFLEPFLLELFFWYFNWNCLICGLFFFCYLNYSSNNLYISLFGHVLPSLIMFSHLKSIQYLFIENVLVVLYLFGICFTCIILLCFNWKWPICSMFVFCLLEWFFQHLECFPQPLCLSPASGSRPAGVRWRCWCSPWSRWWSSSGCSPSVACCRWCQTLASSSNPWMEQMFYILLECIVQIHQLLLQQGSN